MDNKLTWLFKILFIIALIGFGLSVFVGYVSLHDGELFDLKFCFNNDCVGYFLKNINSATYIASSTLALLVSVATVGGIIVALLSYLNSSNTSALSNHIAHFSIFHGYLTREIENLSMVSPTSVDILSLYNFIFSQSRSGKTDISKEYIQFVNGFNDEIKKSNQKAQLAKNGSFQYKDHQKRIISILKQCGITIDHLPRNDFFEAEGQVFSLIEKVNQSFCYKGCVPLLDARQYI